MSSTGLEVFDTTVQKTNIWLNAIMQRLGTDDRRRAYEGLRGVLHALRDRLLVEEAAQLSAQLPMLVRGIYFEGWRPTGKPVKERHKEQFIERVRASLTQGRSPDQDPEAVIRAVFAVLAERVSEGEIADVQEVLPQELRDLWPQAVGRQH